MPFTKIGTLTLDKMPDNFFEFTEQSAFAPSNLIPGIEASPDRMPQGRLFSYADTQRYRIVANALSLPVNAPRVKVANNNQDGQLNPANISLNVNYFPSSVVPLATNNQFRQTPTPLSGTADAQPISKTDAFSQAGDFYRSLSATDKANLVSNLTGDLSQVNDMRVRTIMVSYFHKADPDYGNRLADAIHVSMNDVTKAERDHAQATAPADSTKVAAR